MKLSRYLAGAGLAVVLATNASAQALITGNDVDEVLNAARGYGSATLTKQENGDPQITGKIEGITYQVYFRNCTDNTNCEDLNLYLGFQDTKPTLETINAWNLEKRFSRAYIDADLDECVEMDIDLVKGVTAEFLDAQFAIWELTVPQFAAFIGYKAAP